MSYTAVQEAPGIIIQSADFGQELWNHSLP